MASVLVLSAPYGAGHARVARALAHAFEAEGARSEVIDHFARFVGPTFTWVSEGLFWTVLRWAPALWRLAYALSARLPPPTPMMGGMDRLGARALGRHLRSALPDLVVHVHPTPAGAMAWLRRRGRTATPHGIVVTEFVAHPQWLPPGLDRYFVAADEIRDAVVARGIATERVVVAGIPIGPEFAIPSDGAARGELGLSPGVPAVLVTGGTRGLLGGIAEVCDTLVQLGSPPGARRFQAIVVCGQDASLARVLRRKLAGDRRFRLLGPVSDMARLMGAVDIVVTKAGASTCAETLALERPLLFYRELPGQEAANAAFLERAGAGLRAPDREALARELGRLLDDGALRARLAAGASRIRRPEAARVVAKEMLALVRG
jgi:processive 1,2-diacylglycerol beta-glucosyltransferase